MFGSFSIHQDSNENPGTSQQQQRKGKEVQQGKMAQQGTKRTALGTITNTMRVQPLRAAKVSIDVFDY
jgi:hypothetical protein